jgi:uracil-DNA glycosylase family 4
MEEIENRIQYRFNEKNDIANCRKCQRLVAFREKIASEKRAAYQDQTYWGRPALSFGDPDATLLICGLAPAAHGGNRTGRMFTGDRSGDFLYGALYRCGYANQPYSLGLDDGLFLTGAYVTAAVRCAPPQNKPLPNERDNCLGFLIDEIRQLKHLSTILALGNFAYDSLWRIKKLAVAENANSFMKLSSKEAKPKFGHGLVTPFGENVNLICSYHPSQRNVFTKLLTEDMFDQILYRCKQST